MNSLEKKIEFIKEEMKKIISLHCNEDFSILHYGAYEINPKYLVFWICVETDKMKVKLKNNKNINKNLRELLLKNNYPKEAINDVYIGFESKETVDRESKGDWHLHFQ